MHSTVFMGRSDVSRTVNNVMAPVRRNPWTERIARIGFAAKGVVYMMIGALAFLAASRNGGETTDTRGAVARIGEQPFGQVMLALIAVGLFGYALWRFLQAVADTDGRGTDMKGIAMRVGGLLSGIIHVGLAVFAFRLLLGNGSSGEGAESQQYWTAQVMAQPFGRWLIAAVGAAIVAVAFGQFVSAQRHKFMEELRTGQMSATQRKWVLRAGEWGFSARGVVFAIIGGFLISAAMKHDPGQTRGLEGALDMLANQPYGMWLLGVVAAGLAAYGTFMLVEARYRRVNT